MAASAVSKKSKIVLWAVVPLFGIGIVGQTVSDDDIDQAQSGNSRERGDIWFAPTPTPTVEAAPSPSDSPEPTVSPTTAVPPVPTTSAPSATPTETATSDSEQSGQNSQVLAIDAARELEVKGRAPKTGYDRDEFKWRAYDFDRNGCDSRNDILRRDLIDITIKPGSNGCVVETGVLHDPFTATAINFKRGTGTSNAVQIDHVVALSDAWQKGAQSWGSQTKVEFGNDPLNLLAVDGPSNSRKGDGDAATWLPPNRGFRCEYVARQVAVKSKYTLWVTAAEQGAMVDVLSTCPQQKLPNSDAPTPVTVSTEEQDRVP